MKWLPFSKQLNTCIGLPWLEDNQPYLWRLPKRLAASLPIGVQKQVCFPAGVKLCLHSNTSQLHLRIKFSYGQLPTGLDVFVNGHFWGTTPTPNNPECELVCFTDAGHDSKEITIYLPLRTEIQVVAYGIDENAQLKKTQSSTKKRPIVLYGSSVAQGIGAARPAMGYASILSRALNIELINLGFGGSGKAEEHVVELISQINACCYILDLGKSYGYQSEYAYTTMIKMIRESHPDIAIVCITPIISAKEIYNQNYQAISHHTRAVVRQAVSYHQDKDDRLFLVEGEDLLTYQELDGLAGDGVHPNELGHSLIAKRLLPILQKTLQK